MSSFLGSLLDRPYKQPYKSLFFIFLIWKTLLLLLVTLCPGPGYDTSGLILLGQEAQPGKRHVWSQTLSPAGRLALKLLRWDALYFVKAAERGYLYEQEWAFSLTYNRTLRFAAHCLSTNPSLQHFVWAGIAISSTCHLLAVFVMYKLLAAVCKRHQAGTISFVAAVLQITSPAGPFLCSTYAEAPFALLNMTGMLLYVFAKRPELSAYAWSIHQDGCLLGAGLLFGIATLFRSNGLLNGMIFIHDVFSYLPALAEPGLVLIQLRKIIITSIAGLFLAVGFISPQLLAYKEFCVTNTPDQEITQWCSKTVPSIYSWVQSHYWNVGFLRYWTLSNAPLFLISVPVLWLLLHTSFTILRESFQRHTMAATVPEKKVSAEEFSLCNTGSCSFPQLVIPQLALAITATTNFHVQIINRISSGYPLWHLVMATWIIQGSSSGGTMSPWLRWITRWFVMYALVQGILFGSFLPPA